MMTQHTSRITHASLLLAVTALLTAACGQTGDQSAAVKKAIETHLASRSDLAINQMTMDVKSTKVDGDKAEAEVLFRVTSAPEMQMAYHYELAREGGEWKVLQGRPAQTDSNHPGEGANPDAGGALPPGHPTMPGGSLEGGAMPEATPPEPDNPRPSGELPPGHPPMGGNQ